MYLMTNPFANFVFTESYNRLMGAEGGRRAEIRIQVNDKEGKTFG